MSSKIRMIIGFGMLALAIVLGLGFKYLSGDGGSVVTNPLRAPITVSGYYGGEKESLLKDEDVKRILGTRYNITVNARKAGSIEMVTTIPLTNADDFVWPSSSVSLAMYKERGGSVAGSQ